MIEFVALIGLEAHAGAYAIMRDAARAEGWQITEMEPCGWIAVRNAGVQRVALESGQAFIVGDTVQMRRLGEERFENEEALCRMLACEGWGRYVVLFLGNDGALSGVFRDPSGAVDCARAQSGRCWIVASQTPDWLVDATNDHPPICWTTVAQVLRDPVLLSSADMLSSWRTVTPGVLHLTGGATRIIWSPSLAARRGRPANEAGLRAVVDATVRDMTRARTSILTEVSGGLDSAIMATALKASGFGGEVIWLNTSGPFAESDERRYARAVVEAMDESLTEVLRTSEDMAAGLAFDHPRTLRPSLNRMDATYDALQAELCDRHDVDAVLTGKGGDVAFFQTATSAILSDQIRDQGPGALFSRTAPVLARRLRRSAWRVLKAGWAGSTSAERPAPPSNLLLSGEVENAPRAVHPWLADLTGLGPGKRQQILGFASNLGLHSPSQRTRRVDLLHPALSQPVMEAVLATPTYQLTRGGHDRLLARNAFADRLPTILLQRRSKAELSGYYGRVLAANLNQLRPHLLEGRLAGQGLINRDQVEAALRVEHLIWQGGYGELMVLALVESWLQAWKR
ncbi:MAG TPA: hypothetical protein DGP25_03835 [Brevundimonas sp.]|nr:hypothetical protein [Brevundimonas sp.]